MPEKRQWNGTGGGELAGGGGQAAGDVVGYVSDEQIFDLAGDGAGCGGDFVAGDFAHADDVAIGGGDEDFVSGVKIFGTEGLLDDVDTGFGSDLREDAAGDAFGAAGVQRRRIDFAIPDSKYVRGGAFGDFAPLIEQDHFVESFLLRFRNGPNIGKPGDAFDAGEGGIGMAAVGAEAEADRLAVFGERRGINDEVDLRMRLIAAPESDLIVDEINARAALRNIVGADDFVEVHANLGGGVGHGEADQGGVLFEAAPVALVGESFGAGDANRGEEAPAADEAGLPGRKADSLDGQKRVVMEDVAMNQCAFLTASILTKIHAREDDLLARWLKESDTRSPVWRNISAL